MPELDGFEVLRQIKNAEPDIPVIMLSGTNESLDVVKAMRLGAFDFLIKPIEDYTEFQSIIERAIKVASLREEREGYKEKLLTGMLKDAEAFKPVITQNRAMFSTFQYIEVVSSTSQPVLLHGETGTGKDLLAKIIHELSGCKGQFVSVNIAGLDDHMLSDTLFGHLKGAFTGANTNRDGLLVKAEEGSIFLDEIGDIGPTAQVKLLRLLQEGDYYPVGSDFPRKSSARVITATHRDLRKLVDQGTFREDLFYRLHVHRIPLPPLRERPDDFLLLVAHFVEQASLDMGRTAPEISWELPSLLADYSWPGNVRELRAQIYDAMMRHPPGTPLSIENFADNILQAINNRPKMVSTTSFSDICKDSTCIFIREPDGSERMPTIDEAVDLLIEQALKMTNNNQSTAAKLLNIDRTTLNRRIKRYQK